jgi:oligopeptide/dipeptide ABC transporter ATP-binding protein
VTVPISRALGLRREFSRGWGKPPLVAVDGVDLEVAEGESVGLVGESGSGKSTLGRLVLRLLAPTSGRVEFRGQDVTAMPERALRARRPQMQLVFQDPLAALDPRLTVRESIEEARRVVGSAPQVGEMLDQVGLRPEHADRYPHELSGGQRQRVVIARALATSPRFLVLDEPVSALDVSVQAQVLNLLAEARAARGLSYLFISHDLSVVRWVADRTVVFYLGKVVERGPASEVYDRPLHPYSQLLVSSVPSLDRSPRRLPMAQNTRASSSGCRFAPRCALASDVCREEPALREVASGRFVACHSI